MDLLLQSNQPREELKPNQEYVEIPTLKFKTSDSQRYKSTVGDSDEGEEWKSEIVSQEAENFPYIISPVIVPIKSLYECEVEGAMFINQEHNAFEEGFEPSSVIQRRDDYPIHTIWNVEKTIQKLTEWGVIKTVIK